MIQDSYIRLHWAIESYEPSRSPVFISYWRKVLRNHLLSKYHTSHLKLELSEEPAVEDVRTIAAKVAISEIKERFEKKFASWKEVRTAVFCSEILNKRILATEDVLVSQTALAKQFGYTQAFVSKWEVWLIQKILEEFPDGV